jgi:seryl-tRNA synthetase
LSSSRISRRRYTRQSSCKVPRARRARISRRSWFAFDSQLGATIEQYETQVEEAKASNEELQATNEELRSSAEELETSREELQSVNEELTTVNQELKIKVDELRLTNNDFQNFINATSIPTVFLDRGLHVKFSNVRARRSSTCCRPISAAPSRTSRQDHVRPDPRRRRAGAE